MQPREPLRVGNASGFYGDRLSAVREMLEGGPLDVLTGDYLAELTMLILGRSRMKDPGGGYATTFLRQMEECLGLAVERGTKIVANAGGLNPAGLAARLRELAQRLGIEVAVAHVEGDDLLPRAKELGFDQGPYGPPLTANAYLGAWGIVECLNAGADVVVTGRVTDASLVVGPAAAHFGWARDDWDALAGATAAGHVLECGAQATGGNYAFFQEEIYNVKALGFPLAEIHADGSSVITKHPETGGAVSVGTVTAQLLYEIRGARYEGPDVTTRFDSIELAQDGPDRVRISGVRGEEPPRTVKVCNNHLGGMRNEVVFVLTGLDLAAKAEFVRAQFEAALPQRPQRLDWSLIGGRGDQMPSDEAGASVLLRACATDPSGDVVGRPFADAAIQLALASYPGFHVTAPPGRGSPYGVYAPAYIPNTEVAHTAVLPDGTVRAIAPTRPHQGELVATSAEREDASLPSATAEVEPRLGVAEGNGVSPASAATGAAGVRSDLGDAEGETSRASAVTEETEVRSPLGGSGFSPTSGVGTGPTSGTRGGPNFGAAADVPVTSLGGGPGDGVAEASGEGAGRTRTVPLGTFTGARSGDKGGDANVGVWVRTEAQWEWLRGELTAAKLRELLPDVGDLRVERHEFPLLKAVNFVIEGILQEGVSASTRFDPQGKGLGEWLRSRPVDIPESLL